MAAASSGTRVRPYLTVTGVGAGRPDAPPSTGLANPTFRPQRKFRRLRGHRPLLHARFPIAHLPPLLGALHERVETGARKRREWTVCGVGACVIAFVPTPSRRTRIIIAHLRLASPWSLTASRMARAQPSTHPPSSLPGTRPPWGRRLRRRRTASCGLSSATSSCTSPGGSSRVRRLGWRRAAGHAPRGAELTVARAPGATIATGVCAAWFMLCFMWPNIWCALLILWWRDHLTVLPKPDAACPALPAATSCLRCCR